MRLLRWLLGRGDIPEGFTGTLAADERVLATAELAGATSERHLVVTSWGIWLPGDTGPRRVGWHLVSKATWRDGVLTVVEAEEVEEIGAGEGHPTAVLLADRPPVRLRLQVPGRVPETVHARVEGSIRSRHRRDLRSGGGAWIVQRRVPGRDGVVLQVRPDPGTDPELVRQLAAEVVRRIGSRP